ncbi:MAG: tRNA (guanine(10)-N(2))-dimethyltransferase [Candidatus Nitrosocaldaceae archaeon]|nr:MAG: tRNA (guanine(10)-N(2))-dimethyltransferase [Candidatus Nitrosocaldaceae archaeon]
MKLVEIVEGRTKLLVPEESLKHHQPPKQPVFFNPNARISRDIAILAYKAFNGKVLLDALGGIGVRGIRAKNEVGIEAYINDINPNAIELAKKIAEINNIECMFSNEEANKFLLSVNRGDIVELDPFGTPAYYIDNALRAVKDQGMICLTATDTPVLQGLHNRVAERRYYGRSLRVEYSNELALRLLLGLLARVAGRLDLAIKPLFVHSIRNHMRVYAKITVSSTEADKMLDSLGLLYHCFRCNNRGIDEYCKYCNKSMSKAGALWNDNIFDKQFIEKMLNAYNQTFDKYCKKILLIAKDELDIPLYYALDGISKRLKIAPPKLDKIIQLLKDNGFQASRTSLMLNGFKTDADYHQIINIIGNQYR